MGKYVQLLEGIHETTPSTAADTATTYLQGIARGKLDLLLDVLFELYDYRGGE